MNAAAWKALFGDRGWLDDDVRSRASNVHLELAGGHHETLNYVRGCYESYFVVQYADGNRVYYPWDAILRVRELRAAERGGFHGGIE